MLRDGGNYRAAYNVFDSFVKQYPNDELRMEGLLGMADAFFHDKEYEKAINHYLALIKEDCGGERQELLIQPHRRLLQVPGPIGKGNYGL